MTKSKLVLIVFFVVLNNVYAEDITRFSQQVMDVVAKSPGGDPIADSKGNFYLTQAQADQVLAYSQVNQAIAREEIPRSGKMAGTCKAELGSKIATKPDEERPIAWGTIAPGVASLQVQNVVANSGLGLSARDKAYNEILKSPAKWQSILLSYRDKLSSSDKIELVSRFGGVFSSRYNHARADEGNNAHGFVNTEQLIISVNTGKPGGICRDIALAQTQMLETLGFKDSYVLSYKYVHGHHATVISSDPATGKIIKFNYGEVTSAGAGSGTEALAQDTTMPDMGLEYRIFDTHGNPVVTVPSSLGQMLSSTAGGEDREFTQHNYAINKVSFEKNGYKGTIFTGQTSSGETLTGVAITKEMEGYNVKGHIGLSASSLRGEHVKTKVQADQLYGNVGLSYRSDELKLGDDFGVRGIAGAEGSLLLQNASVVNRQTNYKQWADGEMDPAGSGFLGLQAEKKLNDGKTIIENNTYITLYQEQNHVASTDYMVLATNSIIVDTKLTHQMSDDDTYVLLRGAAIFRNYGASAVVEAGMGNSKTRTMLGLRAPLTSQPTFLPGGTTSYYARAEMEATKNITFGIEMEGNSSGGHGGLSLEGKFNRRMKIVIFIVKSMSFL